MDASQKLVVYDSNAAAAILVTTQVFRDPSAWYHFVVAFDTTQATAANRVKIYVNKENRGAYYCRNKGILLSSGYYVTVVDGDDFIDKNKLEQCEYITLMRKRMEGKVVHTRKAPSKYCLTSFGGTVSIEDFRSADKPIIIKIPGEVFQSHTVIQDVSNKESTGVELRLKREKPLERSKALSAC